MDDLFKGLFGLFFALFLIGAAIYLLILAIPFILYGLSVYYAGRHFRHQTERYQLTQKSYAALVGIGIFSALLSLAIVSSTGDHPLVAVAIAVLLFLVSAICVLGIWASMKRAPYQARIRSLDDEMENRLYRIGAIDLRVHALSRENERIQERYGNLITEKERLETLLREMSLSDAQVWTIRRKEWEKEFTALSDQQIRRRKENLLSLVSSNCPEKSPKRLPTVFQASLLRIEELKREAGKPSVTLETNLEAIDQLTEEKRTLERQQEQIRQEREREEAAYQAFLTSRIALD